MKSIGGKKRHKKNRVAIIIALCIICIVINPYNIFVPARNVLSVIFSPLQRISYATSYNINAFGRFVGSIGDLKGANEVLRSESQSFAARLALLEDVQKENTALREQFSLAARERYTTTTAEVIARDHLHSGTWLELNRGTRQGVDVGMAVIVSDGILVGRVESVSPTTARVRLLIHPQSTVSGVIANSQTHGVVRGAHGLTLIFEEILQKDLISTGDTIVSDHIDQQLPGGLLIGTVRDVSTTQDGLFQKATVITPIDPGALRFLSIIIQQP